MFLALVAKDRVIMRSLIFVLLVQLARCQTFIRNYVGDPEAEMTVPQIIKYWGYPVETHRTTTPGNLQLFNVNVSCLDGYILEMHRIPRGKDGLESFLLDWNGDFLNLEYKSNEWATNKPVVFLQHGLLCTSSVWVMNLPEQSAAML